MLVVERARPGSAAGHGHEPEDGRGGGKGGEGGRGHQEEARTGTTRWTACGCTSYGDRSESRGGGTERKRTSRERKRGHKSR
ncbi:hypothetical protein PUN28_015072 [Cardiocondyla obscurior]|uniref:Uncharacterized protein n=1 Tax=Cardiocondyla obscurior TaxID=286306 RepID=A0AAW2EYQ0_9HYME